MIWYDNYDMIWYSFAHGTTITLKQNSDNITK